MSSAPARLLGRPEYVEDGQRRYFAANQLDRFIAYLAVRGDWVSRDEVVFLFWPDRVDAVGRRNLRKLVHRARQVVERLEVEGDRLRWRLDSDLDACRTALGNQDADTALSLFSGSLLEGLDVGAPEEFAQWLDRERADLRERLIDAVVAQSERLAPHAPDAAAELTLELLKITPLDERAVRCSLRSLAAAGRADDMQQVFTSYARRLRDDVGVEPDDEMLELHGALTASMQSVASDAAAGVERSSRTAASSPAEPRTLATTPSAAHSVPAPWGTTSFVGRRAERAKLDEHLSSALAGHGGVVAVEGEAGVGKTRLIETFLAHLPEGVEAFAGRCYERDLSAPLEPIRAALAVDATGEIGNAPDAVRFAASDLRDRGSVHRELTSRLVQAAEQARAAVLFVDDLQWSDAATLEFLAYTAHRIRDQRVLIVVSFRREDRTVLEHWTANLAEHRAIRTVRLGRFDAELTRSLVVEVLGGDGIEIERFAEFVHAESEGNPFYVLEYLRWLRDTHLLEPSDARRVSAPSRERLAEITVPESIRSLIWTRYRAFDDAARAVLDVTAVIGRTFDLALLERVIGGNPLALWSTFEPLIAAGLIVAGPDGTYLFSHDKLRQTIYESLGPPTLRVLHARVADALAAEGAGDAELAHHFLRAEMWPEAYGHLRAAARTAETDSAWEVARAAHARILTIAHRLDASDEKRFEALEATERLLEFMDRRPEWIDTIERLSILADRIGDPRKIAEAALKRMAMLSVRGDRRGADEAFERADALWTELDDAGSRARGYREVAYLAWMRGDYREVISASSVAMEIDRELGHRRALAATAENISHAYRWLDEDEEAKEWAETAAGIYGEFGDELEPYVRLDIRAWMHLQHGEQTAAASVLEQLLPICLKLEDKHLVVEKHMTLGKVYLGSGRYQDALDNFVAASVQGAGTGDLRHEGYPRISAGVALERLGRHQDAARSYLEAARLLEASYAMTGVAADELGHGDALVLHGGVARRHLNRSDDSLTSLVDAQEIFERVGDANRLALAQMELGALHWSTGHLEEAAQAYRDASDTARRADMPEREIAARASLGVTYRDLGRLEESIEVGRDAVERIRDTGDPLGEAFLLSSLATSYQRAGRVAEARGCLERSLTLRRRCGDAEGASATLDVLAALGDAAAERSEGGVA